MRESLTTPDSRRIPQPHVTQRIMYDVQCTYIVRCCMHSVCIRYFYNDSIEPNPNEYNGSRVFMPTSLYRTPHRMQTVHVKSHTRTPHITHRTRRTPHTRTPHYDIYMYTFQLHVTYVINITFVCFRCMICMICMINILDIDVSGSVENIKCHG